MQNTADTTLLALEQRLQRLHFLLHGDSLDDDASEQQLPLTANNTSASIAARLTALEKSLHTIVANSQAAAELLRLQNRYPHLWDESALLQEPKQIPGQALAAIVLAHTPSYHTAAAQLTSLNDLPLPDSTSLAKLVSLEPRIHSARERQDRQAEVISDLRQRSVAVISQWYELGLVGMGDCWGEWEARLMHGERTVRRAEAQKRREEEAA